MESRVYRVGINGMREEMDVQNGTFGRGMKLHRSGIREWYTKKVKCGSLDKIFKLYK